MLDSLFMALKETMIPDLYREKKWNGSLSIHTDSF